MPASQFLSPRGAFLPLGSPARNSSAPASAPVLLGTLVSVASRWHVTVAFLFRALKVKLLVSRVAPAIRESGVFLRVRPRRTRCASLVLAEHITMAPKNRCSARHVQRGTTARQVQTSRFPVAQLPGTVRPTLPPLSQLVPATTLAQLQTSTARRRHRAGSASVHLAPPASQASCTAAKPARLGKTLLVKRPAKCAPSAILAALSRGRAVWRRTVSVPYVPKASTATLRMLLTVRSARQEHFVRVKARPCQSHASLARISRR